MLEVKIKAVVANSNEVNALLTIQSIYPIIESCMKLLTTIQIHKKVINYGAKLFRRIIGLSMW